MRKPFLTNALLGIIAFCLMVDVVIQLGLIPKAQAGTLPKAVTPTEVVIVGIKYDDHNILEDIRIPGASIPVRVAQP